MGRYWKVYVVRAGDDSSWMLQEMEWEWDGFETYLSDIDEPTVSEGRLFTTPEAAARFAEKHGFTVAVSNPLPP